MFDDKYRCYLIDFCRVIKEEALAARKKSRGPKFEGFNEGYSLGFHRVVDLMQQFAEDFEIDLKELSLDDIDPYRDLL